MRRGIEEKKKGQGGKEKKGGKRRGQAGEEHKGGGQGHEAEAKR